MRSTLLAVLSATSIVALGARAGLASGPPKFVYAADMTGVEGYAVDPATGAIGAEVPGSPFSSAGSWADRIATDPAGKFIYAAPIHEDQVEAFVIDPDTGTLTEVPGSPFPVGTVPSFDVYLTNAVTVDPLSRFVFAVNSGGGATNGANSISVFKMDAATGALTLVPGAPFNAKVPDPISIAIDPSGKFAFVATYWGDIQVYRINGGTGALTLVPGSPFNHAPSQGSQRGFHDLAVAPTGKFLYTTRSTSTGGSDVLVFAINQTTGALTPAAGSPVHVGSGVVSVAITPSGKFAYVSDYGGKAVWAFTLNAATGTLAPVAGSPYAVGGATDVPTFVIVDPSGTFVYTVNSYVDTSGSIGIDYYSQSAFAINQTTGALSVVPGSPFNASTIDNIEQIVVVGAAPPHCTPNFAVTPLPNTQTGNFNRTDEVCFMVQSSNPLYFNCSQMFARTVTVNGTAYSSSDCGNGKSVKLPAASDGKYYFDVSAGTPSWSSIAFWNQN